MNKETFLDNLITTIKWTSEISKHFDFENGLYGTVFRKTNPIINGNFLYNIDGDYATWNIDDGDISNYEAGLEYLIKERRKNIKMSANINFEESEGRILCFDIGYSTHDGIATVESQCFVDESDVPPIDTWFYLEKSYKDFNKPVLFCWIPRLFEEIMRSAIKVEMMESYHWLNDIDIFFNREVMKLLLAQD